MLKKIPLNCIFNFKSGSNFAQVYFTDIKQNRAKWSRWVHWGLRWGKKEGVGGSWGFAWWSLLLRYPAEAQMHKWFNVEFTCTWTLTQIKLNSQPSESCWTASDPHQMWSEQDNREHLRTTWATIIQSYLGIERRLIRWATNCAEVTFFIKKHTSI